MTRSLISQYFYFLMHVARSDENEQIGIRTVILVGSLKNNAIYHPFIKTNTNGLRKSNSSGKSAPVMILKAEVPHGVLVFGV